MKLNTPYQNGIEDGKAGYISDPYQESTYMINLNKSGLKNWLKGWLVGYGKEDELSKQAREYKEELEGRPVDREEMEN